MACCLVFLLLGGCYLLTKLLSTAVVPLHNLSIRLERECFLWKFFRETLSCIRVPNLEVIYRVLYERNMLLRPQEDLDRLPPHKSSRRKGRYGWGPELVGGRLECMLTADGCIDPGDRRVWDVDEEGCSTAYR
jgi:hypothetical protein